MPTWRQGAARRGVALLAMAVVALPGLACDRNIEPYREGEEPSPPDLARIFPGPPPGAGGPGAAMAQAGGGADRAALPPTRTEGAAVARGNSVSPGPAASGAAIEGRIELPGELALARPDGGVLFVIARPQGARGGPPLAVLRIPSPEFPLDFRIGPENVMIPSMRFEGAISLSARLDADGNAMTRGAADLSSPVEEPLSPGATGVRLVLSERG
ncbi:MAG: hypothetical protein H6748_07375 [Spirochaetaceae bacterium]|nr:hypothetical protein [Spirochaetaceae bacterium]HPG25314.1 hypothetical protein [Myxococcota bacterium]